MAKNEEWNNRYSSPEFAYGLEPNQFFKYHISRLPPGKLLLPGDGEGRNALWAAKLGWLVTSFDFSEVAVEKANRLFAQNNVDVQCFHGDIETFNSDKLFDAIALVYLHLPSSIRIESHCKLGRMLNPKGQIFLECYHPDQLGRFSGGPKNPDLFPTIEEIKSTFSSLTLVSLAKEEIDLNEGTLHQGKAAVIRMVAQKMN